MPTNSSIVLDFRPVIDEYNQDGNNIWDTTYQNVMLPYEQQLASATSQFEYSSERLKKDYSEEINKAYESYIANKRAAEFSNYGTGDVRSMIDAMGKAYDENKRNIFETYLANQERLDMQYTNVVSSYYQQALSTQNLLEQEKSSLAENYTNTVYSIHGYLNKLLDNNPELFNTNPLLNQFVYFDEETGDLTLVDEKGFIEALSETNLDTGETTLKSKGGIEDLFNLVTSLGGLNDKNTLSYESYMRNYESDLYSWLSGNSNQNLYQMYDILGFNPQGLFGQGTATQNTLANTFGEGDDAVTMYTVKEGDKEYKPLDPNVYEDYNYDLKEYTKEELDAKTTGILNHMSTGSTKPDKDEIKKGTLQIYNDKLYKYTGDKWVRMIDGSDTVADVINYLSGKYENNYKILGTGSYKITASGNKRFDTKDFSLVDRSGITEFNGRNYKLVKAKDVPSWLINEAKQNQLSIIEYKGKYYSYGTIYDRQRNPSGMWELVDYTEQQKAAKKKAKEDYYVKGSNTSPGIGRK